MSDNVNHPNHYNQSSIETIDFIEAVTSRFPPSARYHVGNAIKYLSRAPFKNGKEDLEKARWYLNRLLNNDITLASSKLSHIMYIIDPKVYITETSKGYKDPIAEFTLVSALTMCAYDCRDPKAILQDCLRDIDNLIKRAK